MAASQPETGALCNSALGKSLLAGDLAGVDPRQELLLLRSLVEEAAQDGLLLSPLFAALAASDPLALADLATGPRALASDAVVRAALGVAASLEERMAPAGLYRRLVALAETAAFEVLEVAVERHPRASWVVSLSDQAEERAPGLTHLRKLAHEPGFEAFCHAHAQAGHLEALVEAAEACQRAEPVAALLAVHQVDLALLSAAGLLERTPDCLLAPWVAAVWGPDPEAFFLRLVPRLQSRRAALALWEQAEFWPRCRLMLERVIPGMREA